MSEKWGHKFTGHIYIEGEVTEESLEALTQELNWALNKFENHKHGLRVEFFGMSYEDVEEKPWDQAAT